MYITKVVLKNIRCFDEFTLELERNRRSVLIVGDNGEGKTTLLRSIAIGLCDESSAAALFRELGGKFVREGREREEGSVDIHLSGPSRGSFVIETKFQSLGTFERVKQKLYQGDKKLRKAEVRPEDFPWKDLFIAGYGAGMRTLGSGSVDSYLPVDAVYSLFRYDEPLQNPELALRKLKDEAQKRTLRKGRKQQPDVLSGILEVLRSVLSLEKSDKIYLTKRGIEVKGPWGRAPLESLGDGYQAMITCVLDLMGRRLLCGGTIDPGKMRGIVLLDEVEQHLHPRWQIKVMSLLTDKFPRMQFITTTHSPLVVSGCKKCKIRKVTSRYDEPGSAYGWRPADVYRNIMDVQELRPAEIQMEIERFRELELRALRNEATPAERTEMTRLRQKLHRTLHASDPTVLSVRLANIKRHIEKERG